MPKLEYIDDNGKAMSTKEAFRYVRVTFLFLFFLIFLPFFFSLFKLIFSQTLCTSRHLSHKFHGKGSGKLKSEKRAKKDEDKMVIYLHYFYLYTTVFN